ncbi:MAG: hypothetical protein Q9208_006005 [Pyrenodesmia sp. 3 TL-2023]
MTFVLYGYDAAAEGIQLDQVEVIPREGIGNTEYLSKFPLSRGKIPGLEGPDGLRLTETLAITTIGLYLARIHNQAQLLGNGTNEQAAQVLSWMSWANEELLPTLALWFLPLIPFSLDPVDASAASIAHGKQASLSLLSALEGHLMAHTYLVGTHLTLADVMVAVYISRGLEWVLGKQWRDENAGIMRHFQMVAAWGPVMEVIPSFKMIEQLPGGTGEKSTQDSLDLGNPASS